MKKWNVLAAVLAAGMIMAGCGQGASQESTAEETVTMESIQEQETEKTESGAEAQETIEMESESAEESAASGYEDNFAVDSAAAEAFGKKVQAAVAQKDLKQLADLTAFPVYVGLNGGISVDSREEFLDLGADQVFTQELVDSVGAADLSQLSPSMAGFVLSDGSKANIIFSVRDGKLAVSGINY